VLGVAFNRSEIIKILKLINDLYNVTVGYHSWCIPRRSRSSPHPHLGIIDVKRKRRLHLQQARQITTDSSPGQGPAMTIQDSEADEAPGTLTLFILPSIISQLRTPFKRSPSRTTVLPVLNDPRSTQARSINCRDDLEGRDTLVEVLEVMHCLQERVAYLEGRSSGERTRDRRLRGTSTPGLSGEAISSEGTSDPLPTYKS
jgi:hypothetical protein